MDKIKNLISKISVEIKELAKKFPITVGLIVFVTLLVAVCVEQDFSDNTMEILGKICTFVTIFGFGTFFTETYFQKKNTKIISYIVTCIISFIFMHMIFANIKGDESILGRSLAAYLITLFSITIYKIIKNENLKFTEYVLKLFRDLLNNSITYGILSIGVSILVVIFVELILDGKFGNSFIRIHILLFGLFYVLSLLYSFSSINKKEVNSFAKGLTLYVLLSLVVVAMLIIYVYIAKIIILRDIPKNIIYRILAGIFVVAFPVWNMASYYGTEKKLIGKITKILPYLYIPFIFLEMYSIGARISGFGITPLRYVSCAFIIFQIIAIILNIYKNKEKLDLLFIVIAIFGIILLVTPLNYENVSYLSQKGIIEKYLKQNMNFADLEDEAKAKVKGAYKYLSSEKNGEKYIPDYLTEEDISQIKKYSTTGSYDEYRDYNYFYSDKSLELDIENYRKITKIYGYENDKSVVKLEKINQKVDFSDFAKEIIKKDKENEEIAKEYFKDNNLIKVDDTHDIYVEHISLEYDANDAIQYFSIEGYLLTK